MVQMPFLRQVQRSTELPDPLCGIPCIDPINGVDLHREHFELDGPELPQRRSRDFEPAERVDSIHARLHEQACRNDFLLGGPTLITELLIKIASLLIVLERERPLT